MTTMTAGPAKSRFAAIQGEAFSLAAIVVLGSVILAIMQGNFLTEFNLYVLLRAIAVTLIVAFAQLVVLTIGQLNLSVGAVGGMVAVCTGGMMDVWGVPTIPAILAGLALGTVAGFANGLLITRTGINGFVITLATASAFTGITIGLNDAKPFYNLPKYFVSFGQERIGPFPVIGVVTIIVTLALAFFFNHFRLGRQILAIGGNVRAATLSGIPVRNVVVTTYALSGFLSSVAAILLMARLGSAQPSIGSDWLLPSFAVPIVGGVLLTGGSAPVLTTVLAAFLIALIQNGLVLVHADPYWFEFLLGAIILGAVGLNRVRGASVTRSAARGGAGD